ncbi:MAG: DUF4145 domain-containing protein [Nanoarchaeota archaeon]|nr:DUF4145 domain-containing protein [Nanoarchaeota archaeon]
MILNKFRKDVLNSSIQDIKRSLREVNQMVSKDNEDYMMRINSLVNNMVNSKNERRDRQEILKLAERLSERKIRLPGEILDEVKADLEEIDKCLENNCLRSAVVLCGRVLETALHRKYYEATGNDLLEKAPGIGLGKVIAKLSEANVALDPGLTQQIHLVNQIRVFSVHKKKGVFRPSREQAEAMVLYTKDVLRKLFG